MSQHDYVIGNDTAANVRADINTALLAIASNNSGASAPATTYANQWWYDSTNDILKIRAEANDAWISVAKLNQTLDQFFPIVGGVEVTATGTEMNYLSGVSSAIQTQLNAKAPLASPALTGTPTAPTAAAATNTTQIATTAFVTTADNLKANLASPALTGTPTAPTAAVATNTTQIATTAFVLANVPAAGGMTLLGTLTTTSGSTQTLSGLTLTDYKFIIVRLNGVSATSNTTIRIQGGAGANADISETMTNVSNLLYSEVSIELATSNAWYISSINNSGGIARMTATSVTTAVTSITFSPGGGTFDAGTIRVYGVK